jgi:EmrB/QacA subfamily drug resistance transporter
MTAEAKRWQALTLVCVAYFTTILDASIVNVALPSIGRDLKYSATGLQWVVTTYAITFGGFLLIGGRAGDLLGRRRMFMSGLVLFSLASLLCGLAVSDSMLVASRALQGIGAAVISPATLAIITTAFEEGGERNKALGIWGAMGGVGAAAGLLFGGLLTRYAGWEWIFFVNVPVCLALLALTRSIIRESKAPGLGHGFDAIGAVSVTGGLALLVYAISEAPNSGWGSAETILLFAVAAAILAFFVLWETKAASPLMPLRIFRLRTVAGANAVSVLIGAVIISGFFLLTLYVQNVLGYSALKTGLTFLATAGTVIVFAALSQALTTRIGPRPVMAFGLALLCGGMLWYTQIPVDGKYAVDLLPGYLMVGLGLAFSIIPVSIAALSGVAPQETGVASGLLNTSQQIGGAIGVAISSTLFISRFKDLSAAGATTREALTGGYTWAFWLLAGLAAVGVVLTLLMVRPQLGKAPASAAHFG